MCTKYRDVLYLLIKRWHKLMIIYEHEYAGHPTNLAHDSNFMSFCCGSVLVNHYDDVIMSEIASQITSLTIVYSTVHLGADQSKHQSSASLAFVWEIHRWPVNFPHKWPVTRKIFPFDDVIMFARIRPGSLRWNWIASDPVKQPWGTRVNASPK